MQLCVRADSGLCIRLLGTRFVAARVKVSLGAFELLRKFL